MKNAPDPKLKVVEFPAPARGWWRFSAPGEGTLTISAEPGFELTNERVAWLLDRAKARLLEEINVR